MSKSLQVGFVGGFLGSLILIAIMLVMQAAMGSTPMYVGSYQNTLGPSSMVMAQVVGGFLFAVIGGLWGALFAAVVSEPTVLKGMLFGIIPTFFVWLFVAPFILGAPLFMGFAAQGLILPFVFNVIVWGGFLGWYCRRLTRRAIAV